MGARRAVIVGEPAKAAAVIISAVQSDAYGLWDQTIAKRIADIDAWHERGLDTAFDGMEIKPIGG